MVWYRKCCVQIYKPKYTNGTFHQNSPNVPDDFFLSIDHNRTVHSVQSSSTLYMELSIRKTC